MVQKVQEALDIIQGDVRLQPFQGVDIKPEFIRPVALAAHWHIPQETLVLPLLVLILLWSKLAVVASLKANWWVCQVDDPEFGTVGLGEIVDEQAVLVTTSMNM